jgi:hypothetical protein
MTQFGFSITKRVGFRESTQEFSNVYFYERQLGNPVTADLDSRLEEIVAIERDLHSTSVSFIRGRVWESGGTPAQNVMRIQKNLSGTGNQAAITSFDRERAVLFMWPAGVDIRGKPVFLRKWYHACGRCNGVNFTAAILDQTVAIPEADRTTLATRINDVRIIGSADDYLLVAQSGRPHTGPGTAHKFLEHHQFGDQWRAQ